ncbi:hypothetical protein [Actinoplanes derwentensis]|uniref:Uncharacterized protein n=1 Tax=Actinoplanes derwentensis TaxID=113562 RepID=A0A1H1YNK6_9ACTN|nr:hypothetical protein [Actinoplanes derwentensis]GID81223.1 hypothetical protein Ade03nite_01470 [Actinoplanes derwentensis]SDT23035.1 hypothetical protein SAMN04489716_2932 [Actinoplanes derwentensis]
MTTVTTTTYLDHHVFVIAGRGYTGGLVPGEIDGWVSTDGTGILIKTPYDRITALVTFQEWDGEPGPEPDDGRGRWDAAVTVAMDCPGPEETLRLDQNTAGGKDTDFSLSREGRYHVRLARRNGAAAEQAHTGVLARFAEQE